MVKTTITVAPYSRARAPFILKQLISLCALRESEGVYASPDGGSMIVHLVLADDIFVFSFIP